MGRKFDPNNFNNNNTNENQGLKNYVPVLDVKGKFSVKKQSMLTRNYLNNTNIDKACPTKITEKFNELGVTNNNNSNNFKGPIFNNVNKFLQKAFNDGRNYLNGNKNINFEYLIPNLNKFERLVTTKLQTVGGNDQINARIVHLLSYKALKKDPYNNTAIQMAILVPFDNRIVRLTQRFAMFMNMGQAVILLKHFPMLKIEGKEFYTNIYNFIKDLRDYIFNNRLYRNINFIMEEFIGEILSLASMQENGAIDNKKMTTIISTLLLEKKVTHSDKEYLLVDGLITNILFDIINNNNDKEIENILFNLNKNTNSPKKSCKLLFVNGEDFPNIHRVANTMKMKGKLNNLAKYNK